MLLKQNYEPWNKLAGEINGAALSLWGNAYNMKFVFFVPVHDLKWVRIWVKIIGTIESSSV